jgi:hypothetical protein
MDSFLLWGWIDPRPAFQLWLFPHLFAALLALAISLAWERRGRLSWRLAVGLGLVWVVSASLTWDGWKLAWRQAEWLELLRWWWYRCAWSAILVFVIVFGLTWNYCKSQARRKGDAQAEPMS